MKDKVFAIICIILSVLILVSGCKGKDRTVENNTTDLVSQTPYKTNPVTGSPVSSPDHTDEASAAPSDATDAPTEPVVTTPQKPSQSPTPEPVKEKKQIFTYWVNFPEKGEVHSITAHKFVITKLDYGIKVVGYKKDNSIDNNAVINVFNNWLCSYELKDSDGKVISRGQSSAKYENFEVDVVRSGGINSIQVSGQYFKGYYKDYNGSNTVIVSEDVNLSIDFKVETGWKFSEEYSNIPKSNGADIKFEIPQSYKFTYKCKAGSELYRDEFENIHLIAVPLNTVDNGVPTMIINTKNNKAIADKINWVEGTYAIVEGSIKEYNTKGQRGNIELKGRGNTSWGMPKKPYNIKLENATGLLGMPDNKDWCLIANYSDKSLMRNYISYYIGAKMSGFSYTPKARYVEVYINNSYCGLYLLVEKIEAAKNKVNIKETVKGEDLSNIMAGSFLVEKEYLDRFNNNEQILWQAVETSLGTMNIKSPGNSQLLKEIKIFNSYKAGQYRDPIKNYIADYFAVTDTAIKAIRNGDYVSYKKYIDVESFVDYIIFQEVAKNIDGNMKVSIFFYKDKHGKLKIGPIWDFDISFGNCNYTNADFGYGPGPVGDDPYGFMVTGSDWFKDLLKDPGFENQLKNRYRELRKGLFNEFESVINTTAGYISKAADKNFKTYRILNNYVWPNPEEVIEANTFEKQVDYLKSWINARLNWLDTQW